MNGVELARSLQRTVSTSDAVTAPPVNRVPLRRTRTLRQSTIVSIFLLDSRLIRFGRSTVLDEPMSAPPRVTRSRQKEVEGSERDLEADRLSPDADKMCVYLLPRLASLRLMVLLVSWFTHSLVPVLST